MSGSGGSGGGEAYDVACSALVINTQIATPNPAHIGTVRVGDVFSVEVVVLHGQQVVAVVRHGTDRIGGLAGGAILRLRDCILAGTAYSATVSRVNGPLIVVRIEPLP